MNHGCKEYIIHLPSDEDLPGKIRKHIFLHSAMYAGQRGIEFVHIVSTKFFELLHAF